jgi:hypothetical protein
MGKDWRWTYCGLEVEFMDEMGTAGGIHEDPWGSVRFSCAGSFQGVGSCPESSKLLGHHIYVASYWFSRVSRVFL